MKVFTPIKEDDHWCCPTCGKRAKEVKSDDADLKRGRPIITEDRYEIWIKQDYKEFTDKYMTLQQGADDLREKGFKISLNQLISCLTGRYKYDNLRIKKLFNQDGYRRANRDLRTDKYEIWIKQNDKEHTGKYPTVEKAHEKINALGFKVSKYKLCNSLHKKFNYKLINVSLIENDENNK